MAHGGIIAWLTVRLMLREGRGADSVIADMTEAKGRPPKPGEVFREVLWRQYLWTDAQDVRHVGWRVWMLLWLLPVLFAVATALLGSVALVQTFGWERGEAHVRQVYAWEGRHPLTAA